MRIIVLTYKDNELRAGKFEYGDVDVRTRIKNENHHYIDVCPKMKNHEHEEICRRI